MLNMNIELCGCPFKSGFKVGFTFLSANKPQIKQSANSSSALIKSLKLRSTPPPPIAAWNQQHQLCQALR